jgi:hypothetical protein
MALQSARVYPPYGLYQDQEVPNHAEYPIVRGYFALERREHTRTFQIADI